MTLFVPLDLQQFVQLGLFFLFLLRQPPDGLLLGQALHPLVALFCRFLLEESCLSTLMTLHTLPALCLLLQEVDLRPLAELLLHPGHFEVEGGFYLNRTDIPLLDLFLVHLLLQL